MSEARRSLPDMHHPWRRFRDEWGHVNLSFAVLEGDVHAHTDGDTVWLRHGLRQVERRCAIAHETIHLERREHCRQPPRVERLVDRMTARRLVSFEQLAAALPWALSMEELAAELWITPRYARALMGSLWPSEVAILAELIADLHD